MPRIASVVIALAFVAPVACQSNQPAPSTAFTMVLERTDSGWSATCASGCRWSTLTFDYAQRPAVISAVGVGPASTPPEGSFAFELTPAPDGWSATGMRGTQWTALSWRCSTTACRTEIDESGVEGL